MGFVSCRSFDAIANSLAVQVSVSRSVAVGDFDGTSPGDHRQKDRGGDAELEFESLVSAEHC